MHRVRGLAAVALAAGLGAGALLAPAEAAAQEIQLTGPLAGAPAVRKLRLHRNGRFELAPGVNFTLLDEFQRTIMPTLKATYHFTDWFGIGLWGGYGFQVDTHLTSELQRVAIDNRSCGANPTQTACGLTAVNITRPGNNSDGTPRVGRLTNDQLAAFQWTLAPQLVFVPFRGKIAFFSAAFVDTDVSIFVGAAIAGLQQRKPCGLNDDNSPNQNGPCAATGGANSNSGSFGLETNIKVAPTLGLGLNFYPLPFFGFGGEFRVMPFAWNPSGFDNHGGGKDGAFPDNSISGADEELRVNPMVNVHISFQLPPNIKTSD